MEIKSSEVKLNQVGNNISAKSSMNSDVKFSDELSSLQKINKSKNEDNKTENDKKNTDEQKTDSQNKNVLENDETEKACDELSQLMSEINQSDDKLNTRYKDNKNFADNNTIGADMINNDFNIENRDKLPQMNPNTNFGGDGQSFSSFMQNNQNSDNSELLSSSKELAEEAAILSTMAENIAMVNDKINQFEPAEKTVLKDNQLKKIDTQKNIVNEVIVRYDNFIMNEADVQVFAELVGGKDLYLNDFSQENMQKSLRVSKNLIDALAKSMEDNKPLRIEFDNGISVIIKISRDGKLSADFLPSTQVAEAYLKENLPLLKQRLSEQNLDYDELNQRERKDRERDQNKKKGREDE